LLCAFNVPIKGYGVVKRYKQIFRRLNDAVIF